jgi:hypothetical protein
MLKKEENIEALKHFEDLLICYERVIETMERIYRLKSRSEMSLDSERDSVYHLECWNDRKRIEKIKAAIKLMEEKRDEYNEEANFVHYESGFAHACGRVEGMETSLRILKSVME